MVRDAFAQITTTAAEATEPSDAKAIKEVVSQLPHGFDTLDCIIQEKISALVIETLANEEVTVDEMALQNKIEAQQIEIGTQQIEIGTQQIEIGTQRSENEALRNEIDAQRSENEALRNELQRVLSEAALTDMPPAKLERGCC